MKPLTNITQFFLPSLCAAWMMGLGLRMIFEIIFNNSTVYVANSFDLVIDWGLLFLFGLSLFIYVTISALKKVKEFDRRDVV